VLNQSSTGARYMLLSALSFSAMGACVKMLGGQLPVAELVAARAIVTLLLSAVAVRRAGLNPLGNAKGFLTLRGLLGFGGLSCVYYSLTHLPIAEATVLQYLHPVFTALLAPVLLREVTSKRVLITVALGLCGALLVGRPAALFAESGSTLDTHAVLIALAGALFSSLAYITVRKLHQTDHSHVIVLYFPLVAVPASLPALISQWQTPQGSQWFWLVMIGVLTQIGQVTLTHAMRTETVSRATSFSYMQILFAVIWGVVFFDEWPALLTWVGALIILVATLLQLRTAASEPSEKAPEPKSARP